MGVRLCCTLCAEVVYVSVGFLYWFVRVTLSWLAGELLRLLRGPAEHPLALCSCDALTADAMSIALGRRVLAVTRPPPSKTGAGGLVADGAQGTERRRLRLELAAGPQGSTTFLDVFVKLPPRQSWLEAFLWFCGLYQTELWFFGAQAQAQQQQQRPQRHQELVGGGEGQKQRPKKTRCFVPPELLPEVYYAQRHGTRFLIVMRDVATPHATLLCLHDTCGAARLRLVLRAQARLHAVHWDAPYRVWSERQRPPFLNLISFASLRAFRNKYPGSLPPGTEATYRRFLLNYPAMRRRWSEPPLTLVHGDCHSGNVYFDKQQQQQQHGEGKGETAGFFDFQVASAEQPMRDVTYFLFYAASVTTLAAHETDLIKYYLQCLADELQQQQGGGQERSAVPTFAEAWEAYRLHAFYALLAAVIPAGLGDFMADEAAVRGFTARVVAHFERIDAAGALDVLLGRRDAKSKAC